jgi:hypothetical protein
MSSKNSAKSQGPRPAPAPEPAMFDWRTFDPETLHGEALFRIKTELTTYRDRLDELLKHEGQYVLIHGSEVVGYFKTREAASRAASLAFGASPVLIKKVAEREPIISIGAGVLVCQS